MQRMRIDRSGRTRRHPALRGPGQAHRGLVLLLAVLPALLAAGFAYLSSRDHAMALDRGWQVAERGAMGAAEHMRRTLAVARLVTLSVAQDIRRDGHARLQAEGWEDFRALADHTPEVTALWVTDAAGTLVAGSTARSPPQANWATRPFFAPLREGADSYLMPLTWGVITRNWYVSYSLPLRSAAGGFLGIVQSALFTDGSSRAYAELELPQGAVAGVFRARDGAPLILWPPPPAADRSMQAPAPAIAATVLQAARQAQEQDGSGAGRLTLETPDGPVVAAWRRIEEGEPMVAAMAMPRSEVLAPFHDRLARNAAVVLLSALPLAALGWTTIRAQRQAARSEARFRGTFEQAAVGVAHVGLDGHWLHANARLCDMLGYTEAELRARSVEEVTHPEDRSETLAMSRRLIAGEIKTFALRKRYLRRDGTVLWAELTASLLHDEATLRPLHGVAVIQDIGARLEAEAARELSERRLGLACAAVGLGVFDVDTRTGLAVVNAEWRAVYGLPPSDAPVSMEERWAVVHPEDRARVRDRTLAAYAAGTGYEEEFRILRHDTGELRWIASRGAFVDDGPQPRRLLGVIQDITARRQAEAARTASDERLAMASVAAGIGVWEVDTATGDAEVNDEYRRLYFLLPGTGSLPIDARLAHVHPEDRARLRDHRLPTAPGAGPFTDEFRLVHPETGEIRWIAARGSAVGLAAQAGRRVVGVSYDITERKREQERETLLAREVDHRARNVLAVVRSIVKLTRADDPRQFAEAVEGRVAALARAHTLLARDRWTGTGLADIVQEELAAYGTGGGQRVVLDGPALRLRPDVVQPLSMVLHELATNAAKYGALSTPQGRLAVSWQLAAAPGEAARLLLSWQEQGGPALSGPPARRGFGAVVVEATVRSQLGGTVTFDWSGAGLHCTIALRAGDTLAEAPPETPAGLRHAADPAPAAPVGRALAGRRVLVVEDEPLVALELATVLEEAGCEVVGPATSLAEALDLARAQAHHLDAAVLDANLHGHSSRPVADILAGHRVKVIYVTGYSSLPPGAGEDVLLLSKPLRDGDLLAALDRLLSPAPAAG